MSPRTYLTRRSVLAATALAVAVGVGGAPTAANAATSDSHGGAVFVQLNSPQGNVVAAYRRGGDGRLTPAGRTPTGGLGGTTAQAPVDALASQNSLVLADDGHVLLAVNAGSDTVTSFAVHGTRLERVSVVGSGGHFPVGVAVRGSLVYALDAGGAGAVSGFRLDGARLVPIPRSTRSLGLANAATPVFITAPGEAGFSPDGSALVVTTKANGTLVGFGVKDGGRLGAPVVTTSTGPVPFSFVWSGRHTLHVTQAGDGRLASYDVHADGSATALGTSAPTGGAALCWVVKVGRFAVGANTGSGTLSTWTAGRDGAVLREATAASPGGAPTDLAVSPDGRFLFSQNPGNGTLGVFAVGSGGHLSAVQTVTGLPVFDGQGMEGIAAA